MKKLMLWIVALAALAGGALRAQDFTGNWQGTLKVGKDLRIILVVSKDNGRLQGKMYSIDQGAQPFKASAISQDGSTVKFAVDLIGGTYEGKLSADGKAIAGTWTQGNTPVPLNFERATKETAWEIPAPPPPPKTMAANADPSFDVATIKPNNSGATSMQRLTINGRDFETRASSLADLIQFAYNVQSKQIIGAPDWIDKDRYDVSGTPDQEGAPNTEQLRVMIRKLIADRFQLKFHHDQRELSAFVLTVGKGGSKLTPTQLKGPLPGIGMQPAKNGAMLLLHNAAIPDFTGFLQALVLDRPVVDRTGLTGRYDFTVTFTPDDSLFNGRPSPFPKPADGIEPAPGFFDALQQQTGLKLAAEKTQVDVLAIDHVEKPSPELMRSNRANLSLTKLRVRPSYQQTRTIHLLREGDLLMPRLRRPLFQLASAAALSVVLASQCMYAQSHSGSAVQPAAAVAPAEFDVVSIKPNTSESGMIRIMNRPGMFSATGVTLKTLMQQAYNIREDLISGGSGWVGASAFDIEGKISAADADKLKAMSNEQRSLAMRQMLQHALISRFKLQTHIETRTLPVYELVPAKGGSKLKEADPNNTYPNGIKAPDGTATKSGMMQMRPGKLVGQGITISSLVNFLAGNVERTVLDKTALTGKYDINLTWKADDAPAGQDNGASDSNAPDLFTAIQEQLGLKLVAGKGPVDTLVIDHVEKPTEN